MRQDFSDTPLDLHQIPLVLAGSMFGLRVRARDRKRTHQKLVIKFASLAPMVAKWMEKRAGDKE